MTNGGEQAQAADRPRPGQPIKRQVAKAEGRVIRVFISSTFRDMQAEREELIKRVFPQLRKLCEQRGVTWGEVDLRWGITEEQTKRGQVLPICLEEIQRCRPYFIGILGERYGWVPKAYPEELLQMQPWLEEHLEHSVTELEILHGVLNDPEMASHAYFYLRDPAYVESIPAEVQADYREDLIEEEIEESGLEQAERRADARQAKLEALKARIIDSHFPVRKDYEDPMALGKLVLEDLTGLINRLYPEGELPDPLDREAAEHEAFAASRSGVYIGRQAYIDRLDAHAQGDGPPLVVLGESGSGKSALLANWAQRYRKEHPEEMQLMHFIGASAHSADWNAMLRRVMGELKRRFEIEGDIPDEPGALREAFANWLHMAAARGRVVLILDALNQLDDREGAPDLVWLPPVIPENVRLILSTLPGRPLDELKERGWPTLVVEPLSSDEREQLIGAYLSQYSKTLSPDRVKRIAAAPQAANPLYLRVMLEELRMFGAHERLDQRIDHYLRANTIDALYGKVLERFEEDYERDQPGLVEGAMSLLWGARRGLSEVELLELLGTDDEPLPGAYWSPLYLAAEGSLVSRAGVIGFSHDYLRKAVRDRYLPNEHKQQASHELLADYFAGRYLGPRKIDELPWQLAQAHAWKQLHDLLADLPFFQAAWQADAYGVRAHWAQVEANSELQLVQAYRPVLDSPEQYVGDVWRVANLLGDTGHPMEALSLQEWMAQHYRQSGDLAKLALSLGNQAMILQDRGELSRAMVLHKEVERICRELGDMAGLKASLGGQALVLYRLGDLNGSMALHKEEERICRELGDKVGLHASLGNQANILQSSGELDQAMVLHKEVERICRELGIVVGLQASLRNQAMILEVRGDLDGAMALLKEQERICREVGNKAELGLSFGSQASILQTRGDLDGAMALLKETERISRELGDKAVLQASLGNQAAILFPRGDLDGAMILLKEQEHICRELGDIVGLTTSLRNQGVILFARDDMDGAKALSKERERIRHELENKTGLERSQDNQALGLKARDGLDGAMALQKEQERVRRELEDKAVLAASLASQASILQDRGDRDGAMALYKEQEHIYRELGDKAGLGRSLSNQAWILQDRGDLDGAITLHKEQERICRELGDKAGLGRALSDQAWILQDRGDLDGAMALRKEEERICRELGDKTGLAASLANQAFTLQDRGDLDGAMELHKEGEHICRELGDKSGLRRSLSGQALILRARGDQDGALAVHKEEERICRELGDKAGLGRSLGHQALILQDRDDLDGAMALHKEQEHICRELGDKAGLAASFTNQALILHAHGDLDGAMALYKEQEHICRELGDNAGLATSLANQALCLAKMDRRQEAIPLAEEAYRLVTSYDLTTLAQQIESIRDYVRQ